MHERLSQAVRRPEPLRPALFPRFALFNFMFSQKQKMASFTSSLNPHEGFHTTSTNRIYISKVPSRNCSLHLSYTLPPLVFVDQYELIHYSHSYTFRHAGTSNLELPLTAVDPSGSSLLLDVSMPEETQSDSMIIDVKVPLHMRYGEPASAGGFSEVKMTWPLVFFACPNPCEL